MSQFFNGLLHIKQDDNSKVLIHDGARPFASQKLITRIIKELDAQSVCGIIPGITVKDTIKQIEGDRVIGTPPRSRLIAAQTPQGFKGKTLYRCYKKALTDDLNTFTDDSSLLEHYGFNVKHIVGEETNFKVTTPQDLLLAEIQLKGRA